jgi:hypothetical protein
LGVAFIALVDSKASGLALVEVGHPDISLIGEGNGLAIRADSRVAKQGLCREGERKI